MTGYKIAITKMTNEKLQNSLCVKVGDISPDPLVVIASSGMDSLALGIVSAAPSISDVSASLNLFDKKSR